MNNIEKAVEAVEKNGMTVKSALKKYKVSLGRYYQFKKAAATKSNTTTATTPDYAAFDQKVDLQRAIDQEAVRMSECHKIKTERLATLSLLYGVLSPVTYAQAVHDILDASADLPEQ